MLYVRLDVDGHVPIHTVVRSVHHDHMMKSLTISGSSLIQYSTAIEVKVIGVRPRMYFDLLQVILDL